MCNLSEAIYQEGIFQGISQGEAIGNARISKLIKSGLLTVEIVAETLGMEVEEVKKMLISDGK